MEAIVRKMEQVPRPEVLVPLGIVGPEALVDRLKGVVKIVDRKDL